MSKTNTNATLTLITSRKPEQLTKVISLSVDGKMVKQPSAQLYEGIAEVKSLATITDFSNLLVGLTADQALVYGVPNEGITSAKVVTKKRYEELIDNQGYITRSNDHFSWPKTAGIMMFDYDPDGEALSRDSVLNILYDVCPAMRDVDHLWWMSSSSNITNTEIGETLTAVTGQRIYVMVNDASDIPRAAKVINDKLWLANHGMYKISASGAMLERSTFDMSVYQPSRFDFAAGAACLEPLVQNRGEPLIYKGTSAMLDTTTVLPDLTLDALTQLSSIKSSMGASNKHLAAVKRSEYVDMMKDKLFVVDPSEPDQYYRDMIETALDDCVLPPDWILHIWDGKAFLEVTVETVLQNKFEYHGLQCLDPIEPDYDGGRIVAKLYLNQKTPIIHSYARGGHNYALQDKCYSIMLSANLHHATEDTMTIMSNRQEVFTYGTALVSPINGKLFALDEPKMKHYLGGIIQYLNDVKKPIDPSTGLVKAVLSVGGSRGINPIKGLIDHPMIDSNLRLIGKTGYDKPTQLLTEFDANDFTVLDKALSEDEVKQHLEWIYAPFVGFELAGNEDKSILYAAIFSAVIRQILPVCPAFAADAPMQGSGKTLLAQTIAIIASGKLPTAIPAHGQQNDDEFRKRLFALLLEGEKACLFDNLVGVFDSAAFAAALTSETFSDRVLGESKTKTVMVRTLFLLTGNNLNIQGDMSRRVLRMRLRPKNDKLTQRKYDFNPIKMASTMRNQIISSVLSLINHWKRSDMPKASGTMTSFDDWDTLVRQPLTFIGNQYPELGLVDVLEISVTQQADSSDKEALIALLIALARSYGIGKTFKASDAKDRVMASPELQDAVYAFMDKSKMQSSQYLGNMLKQHVERNVEGLVLMSKKVSGSLSYSVELTDNTHRNAIEGSKDRKPANIALFNPNSPAFARLRQTNNPLEMVG